MKSPQIVWINQDDPPESFPDIDAAFETPDGLLAAGGDLSPDRLLYAYQHGIFPWFDDSQPILWWSPNPRCVLYTDALCLSRRTLRSLRNSEFIIRVNTAFGDVVASCAEHREGQDGTWITSEMAIAYQRLHEAGWAHSIEVWDEEVLVGGLYGLAIGNVFFGESMFSRKSNASKAALVALCQMLRKHNVRLLDCQVESPHLMSLGATLIPRAQFASILQSDCRDCTPLCFWPAGPLKIAEMLAPSPSGALQ
jgi:leucyl/phenylalanyl-tRNA--protein transferase